MMNYSVLERYWLDKEHIPIYLDYVVYPNATIYFYVRKMWENVGDVTVPHFSIGGFIRENVVILRIAFICIYSDS